MSKKRSKSNNEFKLRIQQQKKIEENRNEGVTSNNKFITIPLKDNTVMVDKNNFKIQPVYIKYAIEDLFMTKNEFAEGERINLSNVADVTYDLKYIGINNNKLMFKAC